MSIQACPECGCQIGDGSYEKEGIFYCREPCAIGEKCECGCCNEEDTEDENEERLSG